MSLEKKQLKKGLTTGAHTSYAFKSALECFLNTNEKSISYTNKMDNDDLDVTKGCEIVVTISHAKDDLQLNPIEHNPHIFESNSNKAEIFAGVGVGVVTKKGLKIQPNYPAINPTPLKYMNDLFSSMANSYSHLNLYVSVSVSDGEELSKQTANSKVGVIGGISILGTTGIVKPVSSSAYIDSVATEIEVASQNNFDTLVFTLGNSALKKAQENYDDAQIVEVGNFIFDVFDIAKNKEFKEVLFICGIGKMTKVAQGFKNTHNRFGQIDFIALKNDVKNELKFDVDTEITLTVKGICEQLGSKKQDFYKMIEEKASQHIKQWYGKENYKLIILDENEVKGW